MSEGLRCGGCREMIVAEGEPYFTANRRVRGDRYYSDAHGETQHFHDLNCLVRWLRNNVRIPAEWQPDIWNPSRGDDE